MEHGSSPFGCYIYCVVPQLTKTSFGKIGIDGNEVYPVCYQDICAVVHACLPVPYQGDDETVKSWLLTHSDVVDLIWKESGTILPMTFDVIVKGDQTCSAEENVRRWLAANYYDFKFKLEEFRGKVELGIKIFWDSSLITENLLATSPRLTELQEEIKKMPPGKAYFYKHKLDKILEEEFEKKAEEECQRYLRAIQTHVVDIHYNKIKKGEHPRMILNLSVLASADQVDALGEELGAIDTEEGVHVRFTGSWPPYSFTNYLGIKQNDDH
ncbi:MAG: GvpL/GvpF family gas vesicle protein [Bacillota bacterium]|nr:GvpL/GvpF family gas vesicle protein [Bacillota bacterium]